MDLEDASKPFLELLRSNGVKKPADLFVLEDANVNELKKSLLMVKRPNFAKALADLKVREV